MKLGSMRYLRSKRSIHLSKTFIGTTIMPRLVLSPVEKDVMYWKRSCAILRAKVKRSSTPEKVISRFLIVSNLYKQITILELNF